MEKVISFKDAVAKIVSDKSKEEKYILLHLEEMLVNGKEEINSEIIELVTSFIGRLKPEEFSKKELLIIAKICLLINNPLLLSITIDNIDVELEDVDLLFEKLFNLAILFTEGNDYLIALEKKHLKYKEAKELEWFDSLNDDDLKKQDKLVAEGFFIQEQKNAERKHMLALKQGIYE